MLFPANLLQFTVLKIVMDGVKRHQGSLASGKTFIWPLSSQNLFHTDFELGRFAKHQIDPLLVQLVAVINACSLE